MHTRFWNNKHTDIVIESTLVTISSLAGKSLRLNLVEEFCFVFLAFFTDPFGFIYHKK